jgi:glycosyltransferase involved in cell wall biosynthesis
LIAGPDENRHRSEVESLVSREGITEVVTFTGPVADTEKWILYQTADLFVLPTFNENFGMVVAEALSSGLPVITTRAAPWAGIEMHRCGWWIDLGVEPLAVALRDATSLSDEQRREMGSQGRQYVEREFSWHRVAAEMREVYDWMLNGGSPPTCVVVG